jgi:hypothetical protein
MKIYIIEDSKTEVSSMFLKDFVKLRKIITLEGDLVRLRHFGIKEDGSESLFSERAWDYTGVQIPFKRNITAFPRDLLIAYDPQEVYQAMLQVRARAKAIQFNLPGSGLEKKADSSEKHVSIDGLLIDVRDIGTKQYLEIGETFYREKKYLDALRLFEIAYNSGSENDALRKKALISRGKCHEMIGDQLRMKDRQESQMNYQYARDLLRKGCNECPDDDTMMMGMVYLMGCYIKMRNPKEAIRVGRELEKKPAFRCATAGIRVVYSAYMAQALRARTIEMKILRKSSKKQDLRKQRRDPHLPKN